MKNLALSILAFVALTVSTFAVTPEETREHGSITGKVTDGQSKDPLPYATITLSKPNDTIIIMGVTSDGNGMYQIKDVPYGKYDVKISFIGYSPVIIKNAILGRNNNPLNLNEIVLKESTSSIAEVAIVQERVKGEQMIDKTVYTVNDDVRNASSSGLDMLKHIPAVTVDFQENVTLEGKSDILFYVDGIERNKDFVAQIDPQLIDKVEIINNPGVKYSADVSGIINIVLKKVKRYGINGSVKADVPNPEKIIINPRGNIEYGTPDFRVYTGVRAHYENFPGKLMSSTNKSLPNDSIYFFDKLGEGKNDWRNWMANYGADWFISERSSLNFYGEWRGYIGRENDFKYYEKIYEYSNTESLSLDNLTYLSTYNRNGKNTGGSFFYSLLYKQKLDDKGSEINAQANYYDYNSSNKSVYDNYMKTDYINNNTNNVGEWNELINNYRKYTELKIDYSRVGEKIKHEAGYQSFYQWLNNKKGQFGNENREDYDYNEMRNIGYYNATGKVNKFNLQGGIRVEHSLINTPDRKNKQNTLLLPQFNASYGLKEGQNIKLTFRRQVNRPSIEDLNPLLIYGDSLHVRTGNPDLKPAIDNRLELEYSINFKSNYFAPRIYATYTSNGIGDYSYEVGNINMITRNNTLDRIEYGVAINGAFQLHKYWRVNIYSSAFERRIKNNENGVGEQMNKISGQVNLTNLFMLPKEWTIFAVAYYTSPYVEYQRTFIREPLFIFGVEKRISKKANLSVFYNPFIKEFTYLKIVTEYENTYETWQGRVNIFQAFAFEFTYNFNYGKEVKKVNRSTQYDQDGGGGMF